MAIAQRQQVILRQAKSAWPDGIPDRQRPLAKRGPPRRERDRPLVAQRARTPRGGPLLPAERARQTWTRVAAELDNPPPPTFDKRIYDAPPAALLTVVRELHPDAETALLIGHNPGLQELVALLSGQELDMKTSSIAVLNGTGGWTNAAPEIAHLREHVTPRG